MVKAFPSTPLLLLSVTKDLLSVEPMAETKGGLAHNAYGEHENKLTVSLCHVAGPEQAHMKEQAPQTESLDDTPPPHPQRVLQQAQKSPDSPYRPV